MTYNKQIIKLCAPVPTSQPISVKVLCGWCDADVTESGVCDCIPYGTGKGMSGDDPILVSGVDHPVAVRPPHDRA